MLRFILMIISVAALYASNSGCSPDDGTDHYNNNVATVNGEVEQAPEFTLYTLEGTEVKLSDYLGKIVILDFWATWCAPCRKSIPDLISIQDEYEDELVVIGISLDQPATQINLQLFINNFGINYPVVLCTYEVSEAYGNIQAIPTSFIIDTEGNIVNKHIGLVPKSTLLEEINSLLTEN
ncbi:MAG: TlpA disulfide reductase family protein [Ignavibacteria bacterium]|nr:TlpA disulfide reductase family protein [Ignavibacteria bacterium]